MSIKSAFQKLTWLNDKYTKFKWRERHVSYGKENSDKTFYVIRRATCKVGLFSFVMTNMGEVRYAIEHGYIPVIDMQNNPCTYLEDNEVGKVNAWELFFEQPCGYSLEDIKNSKNVILGDGLITDRNNYPKPEIVSDEVLLSEWKTWFDKFLNVKKDIMEEFSEVYKSLYGYEFDADRGQESINKPILGVLCRGTDYIRNHPKGHPVQPDISTALAKVKEYKEKFGCEYVYLATEDDDYYQAFRNEFGDLLKITEAKRTVIAEGTNINDVSYNRKRDKYLKGRDYLINIMLLASCDYLVAGNVGGTHGALLMSKGFLEKYVFELGTY